MTPGLGKSSGERNGNLLQYSCLKNFRDGGSLDGYSLWSDRELDMTEQVTRGFPGGISGKQPPPASAGDTRDIGLIPGLGRSPRGGNGDPVSLPGKLHGQRRLVGYSPWSHKETDMTEGLSMHACMSTNTHLCRHPLH